MSGELLFVIALVVVVVVYLLLGSPRNETERTFSTLGWLLIVAAIIFFVISLIFKP